MTMLDLTTQQVRALEQLMCTTCGGAMEHETDALRCSRCGTTYVVDQGGIIRTMAGPTGRMTLAVRAGQWGWVARVYDTLWRSRAMRMLSGESFSPTREIDMVADSINLRGGSVFLDNACANGFVARNIAKRLAAAGRPATVFAVDASLPMLRMARRLAEKDGVADRIVFLHADSARLPFPAGTFDGIVCGGSLNEFTDARAVLSELSRVLDPRVGAFSLMFQVRGTRGIRAIGQGVLASLLGLNIWSVGESIERVRSFFTPEVRFFGGLILILKCVSLHKRTTGLQDAIPAEAA